LYQILPEGKKKLISCMWIELSSVVGLTTFGANKTLEPIMNYEFIS
jgi:hypothetical protein